MGLEEFNDAAQQDKGDPGQGPGLGPGQGPGQGQGPSSSGKLVQQSVADPSALADEADLGDAALPALISKPCDEHLRRQL